VNGYCDADVGHTITDDAIGYRDGTGATAITDQGDPSAERLSESHAATTITDPSKGLSRLQRSILGIAYTVRARVGEKAIAEFLTPLGIYAVYRIVPDITWVYDQHYTRTAHVNAAQAAVSRATTRLERRGLLRYQFPGYFLTDAGLIIATAAPTTVPALEEALRYFTPDWGRRYGWFKEGGQWRTVPWNEVTESSPARGYRYQYMYEDLAAMREAMERQ